MRHLPSPNFSLLRFAEENLLYFAKLKHQMLRAKSGRKPVLLETATLNHEDMGMALPKECPLLLQHLTNCHDLERKGMDDDWAH